MQAEVVEGEKLLAELASRKEEKLIRAERHPTLPLTIYNYTERVQYHRRWDEYTLMARGLILDDAGKIVARPFGKFFNLGEPCAPQPPDEPFVVQEKLDGSLIIVTKYAGHTVIASRGSFVSWHAFRAMDILDETSTWGSIFPGYTYLFELIHPENRIVLDYGEEKELYLLAIIDTESGEELPGHNTTGFPIVPHHWGHTDLSNLPERDDKEGYVIRFESGTRLKVKHPNYVRLHRIVSGLTEKNIWEALKDGVNPLAELDGIPDEIYEQVEAMVHEFSAKCISLVGEAGVAWADIAKSVGEEATRKDWALAIQKERKTIQPILFAMLSEKDADPIIWKALKPETNDEEEVA